MFARGGPAVRVRAVGFYAGPGPQLLLGLAMADKGFAVYEASLPASPLRGVAA